MGKTIRFTLNGKSQQLSAEPDRGLLVALRHELGLTATRIGCGEGHCGTCHVMVEGRAITACTTPLWSVEGRSITTLEGLGDKANPHPLQQAFINEQAMQCGYCVSGIIMVAAALLATNPNPMESEIRVALDENLCRCGAHNRMVTAIQRAAILLRNEPTHG
jgi:nicotinate dehydrogenase subunit A